jgi:hypothetical protein
MIVRRLLIPVGIALVLACSSSSWLSGADDGVVTLFDGESLDEWRGYRQETVPAAWTVEDRSIHGTGSGPDLITKRLFGDFELQFEWKISPGGNSGLIYRATEDEAASYQTGLEYQLLDDLGVDPEGKGTLHSTAAVYALYGSEKKDLVKPAGEFNVSKIVVNGNHVEHWLNETKVVECFIGSDDWNKRLAASKFAKWNRFNKSTSGHIVLQSHGSPVWFRNIRIKELGPEVRQ